MRDIERLSSEKEKLSTELALLSSRYNSLESENNKRLTLFEETKIRLSQKDATLVETLTKLSTLDRDHEFFISQTEEKIVYLQMQVERNKQQEESKEVELQAGM